jgi:hypothetical protein
MKAAFANIEEHLIPTLETVSDPEVPVLTVLDLGVIREAVEKKWIGQYKAHSNLFWMSSHGRYWRRLRSRIR